MADVSSIGPRIHTDDRSAALEDILITSELACRPPRAPDYASENRALVALAHAMAIDPHNLPQSLVDMAIDLCQAGTAGISVLKTDADGEYLAWEALAGVYAIPINGPIPRHFSPCGDVPDWNTPQLFSYPARYFTDFAEADAPIVEALVVALYGSGQPLGMLWLMAHDEQRHFDAEDVRLMTSLAAFASAALRTSSILETEAQANQARGVREEPRKATPKASLAAGVGPGWPVVAPQHTGEWQFRRLLEKLPAGAYTCDPDGLITYFNPQAVELWGRPPS